MEFLPRLFIDAVFDSASPYGDRELCRHLQERAVAVLNKMGYFASDTLQTLENDKSFFNDIFLVFCDFICSELKKSDKRAFMLSVASTSMLGGMYAYCAKRLQKRYKFRFGPSWLLSGRFDKNLQKKLSEVIDYVIDGIDDIADACNGRKLRTMVRVMYDTGMTIGPYFLNRIQGIHGIQRKRVSKMDYAKQAAKEDPFDGLSMADKKKMIAYFHHFATPRMNDEEIYRRYGFCLPFEEQMYLDEEMQLAMQIEMELANGRR